MRKWYHRKHKRTLLKIQNWKELLKYEIWHLNYILDSENKKGVKSQKTLKLWEAMSFQTEEAQQGSRTKDERNPQKGTYQIVQKPGNEEKFLNTSRKRKEQSVRSNRNASSADNRANSSKQTKSWISTQISTYSEDISERIKDVFKYATLRNHWFPQFL